MDDEANSNPPPSENEEEGPGLFQNPRDILTPLNEETQSLHSSNHEERKEPKIYSFQEPALEKKGTHVSK